LCINILCDLCVFAFKNQPLRFIIFSGYNIRMTHFNPPSRVVLAHHPTMPEAVPLANEVRAWLTAHGVEVSCFGSLNDPSLAECVRAGGKDLLIVFGGDGTMLRAGHLTAPLGMPVLGINLGRFGFLFELQPEDWQDSLPRLLTGDYRLEQRMTLLAEHFRGDAKLGAWTVVNEVAVCRGGTVRPVRLRAEVDGYPLASYVADGLIAATPTGSTAYALAVGGPILPPELRNILVIPIAPHLSVDRGIVLAEGSSVDITVYADHAAVLSVDGHLPVDMANGDRVHVSAGADVVRFVRFHGPSAFYRGLMKYMEQNPSAGDAT
jgi:NAD+ kinase